MSAFSQVAATTHRRPSASTVLVALPLLAVLLGALLALAFGGGDAGTARSRPSAPRPTVAAGDLRLALPPGWAPQRGGGERVPGFGGAPTAHVRGPDADVAIALLPAQAPSLLPRELADATTGRPRLLRVGAKRGYRYVLSSEAGHARDVVAVATTRGIATIACSAAGACDRAVRGLRLARGSFLALSADAAFLARLPAVTKTLDDEHLRTREQLARTADVEEAAQAATRLGAAYETAGRALRPLTAPRGAGLATVQLLDRLRSGYDRLAVAVRRGDRSAFKATASAIDGDEARLAARLQAWQRALAGAG